jgi:hypothetical protein
MATEVYSCRAGQALKKGRLDYAPEITHRSDAKKDAERRCDRDPSIHRVAYYDVTPEGGSRLFFSYENPRVQSRATDISLGTTKIAEQKKPVAKKTLLQRIVRAVGLSRAR